MTDRRARRSWLLTIALYLPALLLYAAHYSKSFDGSGQSATGFIQYDMAYYLANAREYQDGGSSGLLYAQPFSFDLENRPLYFQPQIFLLGMIWKWTGFDPGLLFVLFGVIVGVLCVRVCQHVLAAVVPTEGRTRVLGDVLFLWGGGLLLLAGLLAPSSTEHLAMPYPSPSPLQFDPSNGWWFLNLGRNLVYPFEAYYHLLFFAALLAVVRHRFRVAAALLALLAISHPFTGVAGLLIFGTWAALERWYVGNAEIPISFIGAIGAVLAVAALYYGVWLPRDNEHAELMRQWTLPWLIQASSFVPAYALVAAMAAARVRTPALLRSFLASPTNRLLATWVVVNFALENHEFAFTPHQPLHFTRGYVWSALFLIGAPWLIGEAIPWLRNRGRGTLLAASALLLAVFTFDNALWLAIMTNVQRRPVAGLALSADDQAVLARLNAEVQSPARLISQSERFGYIAAVYTPLRPYVGHPYNTSRVEEKRAALQAFFRGEVADSALRAPAWVVAERRQVFRLPERCRPVLENETYVVCRQSD